MAACRFPAALGGTAGAYMHHCSDLFLRSYDSRIRVAQRQSYRGQNLCGYLCLHAHRIRLGLYLRAAR
jgi:hypothetical protein